MSVPKTKVIEGIYEAFGRGDVGAILAVLTDDVNWAAQAETPVAPWHGVHKHKGEVPSFFIGIASSIDVHHWWHFEDGMVAHYRGSEDTALIAELLTP